MKTPRPEVTGRRIGAKQNVQPAEGAGTSPKPQAPPPKRHHLDRHAGSIAAADDTEAEDDLLTCAEVAQWLSVSTQWLEAGRGRNYGPKYTRLSPRLIRYRRRDVREWLLARAHSCTKEYQQAT